MRKYRLFVPMWVCLVCLIPFQTRAVAVHDQGTWETTLLARDLDGNTSTIEAYYDTLVGVTWLADANLAASISFGVTGISSEGSMDWNTTQEWLSAMNTYGGTGYLGFSNWQLPPVSRIDGTDFGMTTTFSVDGTTDNGYNLSAPGSLYEGSIASALAHMYHNTLGNLSLYDLNGQLSGCNTASPFCLTNTGPFDNISQFFWSIDDYYYVPQINSWQFNFYAGRQDYLNRGLTAAAWAVHPGDIGSPVPIPATAWLFGSGLLGLIGIARRKRA
jgi:hypothetical protein